MTVERMLRSSHHPADPGASPAPSAGEGRLSEARRLRTPRPEPARPGAPRRSRRLSGGFRLFLAATLAVLLLPLPVAGAGAAVSDAPVVPILFPLEKRVDWVDTFGAPRSGGRTHEGNDLMVPKMTPVLAVVAGTLDWMNMSGKTSSYNGLPYYNILLRGDDGNDYFYIHLNNDTPGTDDGLGGTEYAYAPGLTNGSRVEAGQLIGWAGDSGNAEDVGSQLHFEIHLGGYKNPIDPYNSLKAAPTYEEWVAAGGSPPGPVPGTTTTTVPAPTTTVPAPVTTVPAPVTTVPPVTGPPTTPTTKPPIPTTTLDPNPGPGGQLDPELPLFLDIHPADWFYEDLAQVYVAGVVKGGRDGLFRPYEPVTRAQFAAFLVRAFAPAALGRPVPAGPVFADVPRDFWGFAEIAAAAEAGLVRGIGDGARFAPNASITRAQMAAMICRALTPTGPPAGSGPTLAAGEVRVFADVPLGYWAAGEIADAYALGVVSGSSDGRFRPEETTKRAQAVAVVARALRLQEGSAGD